MLYWTLINIEVHFFSILGIRLVQPVGYFMDQCIVQMQNKSELSSQAGFYGLPSVWRL